MVSIEPQFIDLNACMNRVHQVHRMLKASPPPMVAGVISYKIACHIVKPKEKRPTFEGLGVDT
tara:strand:- start:998 stop:1186 length:189 start_codon:yes stop_codon:yes gene_type:complete